MISAMRTLRCQKVWFGLASPCLFVFLACIPICFVGCNPAEPVPNPETKAVDIANAPPLKLALVESDGLAQDLALRWQSYSDQKLEIINMRREEFATQSVSTVDVLIYPANFIGTLVDRDWIAPVPEQVKKRTGAATLGSTTREAFDEVPTSAWPSRWRGLAMFGGKLMAIPLGAPSLLAISKGIDEQPLLKLHQQIISNQNSAEVCSRQWEDFLEGLETEFRSDRDERRVELESMLVNVSPETKQHLVIRFLWILATTESRYRGLFDMYKIQSRLNQPEFARSARYLQRLALVNPQAVLDSPSNAWDSVVQGSAPFAIGWPRTDNEQRLDAKTSDGKPWSLLPILWNDGSGLVASLGRRTRQSASASEFMVWIAAEEQRMALQPKTARIELIEMDNDRNRVREDYRDYQTMQRLEAGNATSDLTPRFVSSDRFLALLGDALVETLREPQRADENFVACRQAWDGLIDEIGREKLRVSLEAASGYAK